MCLNQNVRLLKIVNLKHKNDTNDLQLLTFQNMFTPETNGASKQYNLSPYHSKTEW